MSRLGPVTYKLVLDKDGALDQVELWQNESHIALSFSGEGSHKDYSRWDIVKAVVEKLQQEQRERAGYIVDDEHNRMLLETLTEEAEDGTVHD